MRITDCHEGADVQLIAAHIMLTIRLLFGTENVSPLPRTGHRYNVLLSANDIISGRLAPIDPKQAKEIVQRKQIATRKRKQDEDDDDEFDDDDDDDDDVISEGVVSNNPTIVPSSIFRDHTNFIEADNPIPRSPILVAQFSAWFDAVTQHNGSDHFDIAWDPALLSECDDVSKTLQLTIDMAKRYRYKPDGGEKIERRRCK